MRAVDQQTAARCFESPLCPSIIFHHCLSRWHPSSPRSYPSFIFEEMPLHLYQKKMGFFRIAVSCPTDAFHPSTRFHLHCPSFKDLFGDLSVFYQVYNPQSFDLPSSYQYCPNLVQFLRRFLPLHLESPSSSLIPKTPHSCLFKQTHRTPPRPRQGIMTQSAQHSCFFVNTPV